MIELLQLGYGHSVQFADGSERFTALDGVSGGPGRMWHRCYGHDWFGTGRFGFADHDSGLGMGKLLFQFENLLREDVDLGVLLVDFFRQQLKLQRFG